MNKTVVFDFDGVIHSYKSGWKGISIISDEPVPGIGEAISRIRLSGYKVVVVSSRCRFFEGRLAISQYLEKHGIEVDEISAEKPPAVVYVDDRAICFDGNANKLLEDIVNFEPWMKKKKVELVNHPAHYNTPGRKECIEEMVDKWGAEQTAIWCEMTAYKYEYRAGEKGGNPKEQDMKKRQWYLDKAKELRKNKRDSAAVCNGNPAAMQMAVNVDIAAPTADFAAPACPTAHSLNVIKEGLEKEFYEGVDRAARRKYR